MGKRVARLGDAESHNCQIVKTQQHWVFIDGREIATVQSIVCCGIPPSESHHSSNGEVVSGSSVWYIDGKAVARIGDPTQHYTCGGGKLTGACDWVTTD